MLCTLCKQALDWIIETARRHGIKLVVSLANYVSQFGRCPFFCRHAGGLALLPASKLPAA